MVSEFMLQQTPVARVLPVHEQWLRRWPTPAALAAEPPGEAVRAWGRLGYPRRALRLHAAATAIVERHGGEVPAAYDDLLALPGVGDYTAAAIATFAYGRRHVVLDTNVRRVLARAIAGVEFPAPASPARSATCAAACCPRTSPPPRPGRSRVMELGALVCVAAQPAVRRLPGRGPVRLAGGRLPGVRRPAAQVAGLGRHRPPVPRPAAGRAARQPTVRCTGAALDAAWAEDGSGPAAWPACSRTAWSSQAGPATYSLP